MLTPLDPAANPMSARVKENRHTIWGLLFVLCVMGWLRARSCLCICHGRGERHPPTHHTVCSTCSREPCCYSPLGAGPSAPTAHPAVPSDAGSAMGQEFTGLLLQLWFPHGLHPQTSVSR